MAEFPTTARVVIIGGGVVGTSTLFHLARAGLKDCVLLEKNELTAGSTWHAAGNCPNFAANWAVMNMQRFGLELYRKLGEMVDYPMNYHVTGSLRLAHSKERMQEFEKVSGQAAAQGLDMPILTNAEMKELHPFLETHDLMGGMHDALDGDIDPAQLTQALAKGARDAGGRIERFCPVKGIDRDGDEWIVKTAKGDIRCEKVVNCAGYYAQRVGEMFKPFGGRTVPMVVMSHQYFLTGQMAELEAWTKEKGHKLPLLRDVDVSYYLRQDKYGLNLGPYERNCKAHWVTPDDPMPEDFSFQLYPDDLERLEYYIEDAMERVPLLGMGGVERNINGPIPYAPDGLPMIGPMPGCPNAFEGHSFTFGIAQGGGAGKVLAEWIMHGETELDMWSVDPRRYTDYADHDYCLSKALETYGHEYAMHFPHHEWPAGREKKLSQNDAKLRALGGQMGAYNGWERANWFAQAGEDTSEDSTQTWDRNGPWEAAIKREVEAVRDGVGVLDLPGFSRFKVAGKGARDWLNGLTVSRLPSAGRLTLAYFSDSRGRILTEMSVFAYSDEEFTLITAATAQWHDFDVLKSALPNDGSITLTGSHDGIQLFDCHRTESADLV